MTVPVMKKRDLERLLRNSPKLTKFDVMTDAERAVHEEAARQEFARWSYRRLCNALTDAQEAMTKLAAELTAETLANATGFDRILNSDRNVENAVLCSILSDLKKMIETDQLKGATLADAVATAKKVAVEQTIYHARRSPSSSEVSNCFERYRGTVFARIADGYYSF